MAANVISVKAHGRAAHVKAAAAAGRNRNKVRESMGIRLLPTAAEG